MTLPKSLTTVTTYSKCLALWLFLFLPFAGFYLGMQYQQQSANLIHTNSVEKTVANAQDELWKTYKNTTYGYSIKYPIEKFINCFGPGDDYDRFSLFEGKDSNRYLCGAGEQATDMYIIPVDKFVPPVASDCILVKKEDIVIGGMQTVKYTKSLPKDISQCGPMISYDNYQVRIPITHNKQLLEIYINERVNKEIKYEILSTLRFLDEKMLSATKVNGIVSQIWYPLTSTANGAEHKETKSPVIETILVKSVDGSRIITEFTSNLSGYYSISLPPGKYLFVAKNTTVSKTFTQKVVTVEANNPVTVDLEFEIKSP